MLKNRGIILFMSVFSSTVIMVQEAKSIARFNYDSKEIQSLCSKAVEKSKAGLEHIIGLKTQRTFINTVLALEKNLAELAEETSVPTFLSSVSPNQAIRDVSRECETAVDEYMIDIFTRKELFQAIQGYASARKKESLEDAEKRLVDKFLLSFKRNGMELSESKRKKVIKLQKELVNLQNEFAKAIAEYSDELVVTAAELEGLPASYVEGLEKVDGDRYKITLSYPHYFPFMENAKNAEVRKKLFEKYSRRAGPQNVARLEKALAIRSEIAALLGYNNHAAFVLEERMAKDPGQVIAFLEGLHEKLKPLLTAELEALSAYKSKDLPIQPQVMDWDWRYYDNKIMKEKYQLDPEAVREYFPLEHVTQAMFEIYQTLLGVSFREVKDPAAWHPSVRMFEVRNKGGQAPIAYFYMDLFPRDGKYTHAAAFTLRYGRYDFSTQSRVLPVSAIVANFSAPSKNRPSLLEHSEVETYFHEFGHIMHQLLTESKFGWFSGTRVERDFVEAPSQMLENWTWDPATLKKISKHFLTGKPLPDDFIDKMLRSRNLNVALKNCRQILFGLFDMRIHTAKDKKIDTTEVWRELQMKIMNIPLSQGAIPQAAFGHFMGGYDAAYYGYLWSQVYSADMFARFKQEGLLSSSLGQLYRTSILAPGGTEDAAVMIRKFLGREPNSQAFLNLLGLK